MVCQGTLRACRLSADPPPCASASPPNRPFMTLGAKVLKRRAHEKSPQELYQERFAATQRRRDHENALAAQVSLRRIGDRTNHLQREAASLERLLQQTQHAKKQFTASAPTLPPLSVEVRPATVHSMSLGCGRGGGEFNIDKL